ncbi:MAG: chaperone NapD [Pseudomonadota bacterium]
MPILSYLVLPRKGAMDQLCSELSALDYCEIIPSDNQEVVVLVTDTPDEITEKNLQKTLKNLPSLQSLSMTFGHNAELNNK